MATDLADLDLMDATTPANAGAPAPRKCYRHAWITYLGAEPSCRRCGRIKDPTVARRNRNNGKRGRSDEAEVARILGGRKVGPMGWAWDVELPGYLRVQAKKLASWPSVNEIVDMLDAIPQGAEMRAVTLADAPGAGKRTRRLIVLDLYEYTRWHGRVVVE